MATTDLPAAWGATRAVLNAPMGGVAGGRLAAAVSAAGGLGMIGMGSAATTEALSTELRRLGSCRRFGVGFVDWVVRRDPAVWRAALDAGPLAISVSFGEDLDWVGDAQSVGAAAITQVSDVEGARRAADGGVDVVVARGLEGGGHGVPRESRDRLLAGVLAAVDVPVLAAGAISDSADVAAVLDAGAAGVWVGTAFAACEEALTTAGQRATMIAATGEDTVLTRAVDALLGYPWPADHPSRVVGNEFVERWSGREHELVDDPDAIAELRRAVESGDARIAPVDAGTGVGAIERVRSVAQVVDDLMGGR
jgi:nitronate monooxygenase